MAKIFIGQRVTGEDINNLRKESVKIVEELKKLNHDPYCTFLEGESFEKVPDGGKLTHAFNVIDKCNTFLAIVRNEGKSEGLLMEIGYALAKKLKVILLINKEVTNTYLREVAENVIEYEDNLFDKLGDI